MSGMTPVTPVANAGTIICSCGNTMEAHRCPSSIGYAPRMPKSQVCSACGLKQHQNLEGSTVRLECLWRQWAHASGQLQVKVGKTVRYAVPPPTAINVVAFGAWIASGRTDSHIVADATHAAMLDSQETTTASGAKRAEERARNAPAMPNQSAPEATYDPVEAAKATIADLAGDASDDPFPDITIGDDLDVDNDEPTNADLSSVVIQIPQEVAASWAAQAQPESYDDF